MKETFYERIGEAVCRERLTNGLEVCVVPKPSYAKKYAFFSTRYGGMDTRFCLDGQWLNTPAGIAHYLEHKMFDTREGNALQELAKNGAEPNAFTSNAMTAYYFDSTEHFEENLRILLSFVSIPYFTDESVAKEQGIIGQEIRMIEDNPDWQIYTRMLRAMYHRHAARTSIAGTVESIAEITADTLYDCHKAFYTPANMILTVVGDVDPVHVIDLANRVLPEDDNLLDNQDLCLLFKVSIKTLQRYRAIGALPYFTISGKVYYKASDVREFIKERFSVTTLRQFEKEHCTKKKK